MVTVDLALACPVAPARTADPAPLPPVFEDIPVADLGRVTVAVVVAVVPEALTVALLLSGGYRVDGGLPTALALLLLLPVVPPDDDEAVVPALVPFVVVVVDRIRLAAAAVPAPVPVPVIEASALVADLVDTAPAPAPAEPDSPVRCVGGFIGSLLGEAFIAVPEIVPLPPPAAALVVLVVVVAVPAGRRIERVRPAPRALVFEDDIWLSAGEPVRGLQPLSRDVGV